MDSPEFLSPFSRLMELSSYAHEAVINLHDVSGVTLQVPDLRVKPDQLVHHGDFCRFVKLRDRNIRCSQNKAHSVLIAAKRDRPFWGCCPFGVWDMAWPIKHKGTLVAVLYLGYFLGERNLASVSGFDFKGAAPASITPKKIKMLVKAGQLLSDNAALILDHWVREGGGLNAPRSQSFYRAVTERFIASHFTEHVSLGDFAAHLGVHPHYLGKMILRACGKSFATVLRRRRIEQAKVLLRGTTRNVTDIAYETGFQDSNYFSTIFQKEEGVSPRAYRQEK